MRTRRPKNIVPLKPITIKVTTEQKKVIEEMAEKQDRSLSYTCAALLLENPKLKKRLELQAVA